MIESITVASSRSRSWIPNINSSNITRFEIGWQDNWRATETEPHFQLVIDTSWCWIDLVCDWMAVGAGGQLAWIGRVPRCRYGDTRSCTLSKTYRKWRPPARSCRSVGHTKANQRNQWCGNIRGAPQRAREQGSRYLFAGQLALGQRLGHDFLGLAGGEGLEDGLDGHFAILWALELDPHPSVGRFKHDSSISRSFHSYHSDGKLG